MGHEDDFQCSVCGYKVTDQDLGQVWNRMNSWEGYYLRFKGTGFPPPSVPRNVGVNCDSLPIIRTLLRPPRFQMLGSSDLKPGGHNRLTQLPYPDSHLQDPNETGRTEAEGSWSELRIWETGIWGSHTGARMPRHPTCGEIRASPLHRPDLIGGTLPPASPVRLRVPRR